jgi:hypothetical protein
MLETIKDMKHGKTNNHEPPNLERTATQILHHMEDKDEGDSLEAIKSRVLCKCAHTRRAKRLLIKSANARAIYGPNRCLDVISFAPASSRKIGVAIVEHNPSSKSYIHCVSAKERSRQAALEHLLVITEDILHRLMDAEGIAGSGWLPATPQAQHAAAYNAGSVSSSVAGSSPASRRSSVVPQE